MTTEIKIPSSGESITSANVANWHKQDGDTVRRGEVLVTLETDKVATELEAPVDGILEILVREGEEVPIGSVIAILKPSGVPQEPAQETVPAVPQVAPEPSPVPAPVAAAASATPAAPAAQESEQPPVVAGAGRTTRRKMSILRRKIANHLVNAQHTAAILTTFHEVDMTSVMELRQELQHAFQNQHGVKLGLMSFFVKAVTLALKEVPALNASIDGTDIIENHFYDIGVAIGSVRGLIVPVIRDADKKSFAQIERDILDYANRARDGKITISDLQGGVFTISNGGTYGSLLSTPILNPPQSGILGMHAIQQRPVVLNGQIVIRPMMYLALSYDHRLVDGKEAVTFLVSLKAFLEAPARMMLEL